MTGNRFFEIPPNGLRMGEVKTTENEKPRRRTNLDEFMKFVYEVKHRDIEERTGVALPVTFEINGKINRYEKGELTDVFNSQEEYKEKYPDEPSLGLSLNDGSRKYHKNESRLSCAVRHTGETVKEITIGVLRGCAVLLGACLPPIIFLGAIFYGGFDFNMVQETTKFLLIMGLVVVSLIWMVFWEKYTEDLLPGGYLPY